MPTVGMVFHQTCYFATTFKTFKFNENFEFANAYVSGNKRN